MVHLQVCLLNRGVKCLICGSIGGDLNSSQSRNRIMRRGPGNTDQAVESYLKGELVASRLTATITIMKRSFLWQPWEDTPVEQLRWRMRWMWRISHSLQERNVGKTAHITEELNDGTQFDSSYDRGEPLEFICGAGQMIRGLML